MENGSALKMACATIAFGVLHSALASRRAKDTAARLVGQNRCDAGYRLFYIAQSLGTSFALARYGMHLPSRTLYKINGPAAMILRCGQIAGLLHLWVAASQVGIARLSGVSNLSAWLCGKATLPPPVAQGPEIEENGHLTLSGPYLWSRHPLNLSGIPVFWLTPHMTTKRLAFNLASTAYFILGSQHEAIRLRKAYGKAYRDYEQSHVPFFWPRINQNPSNIKNYENKKMREA